MLEIKNLKPGYKAFYLDDNYVIKSGIVIGLYCGSNNDYSKDLCIRVRTDGQDIDWKPEYLTRSKEEAIDSAIEKFKQKLDEYIKSEAELKIIHNIENIISFIESQR